MTPNQQQQQQQQLGKVVSFDWSDFLVLDTNSSNSDSDEDSFFSNGDSPFHYGSDTFDINDCHVYNSIVPGSNSSSSNVIDTDDDTPPPPPPSFESPCEEMSPPPKQQEQPLLCYSPKSVVTAFRPLAFRPRRHYQDHRPTKIRFAPTASVRTFHVIASDHPCCSTGLALELGWKYQSHNEPVNNGDSHRRRCRRRSYHERRELLLEHSSSEELNDLMIRQRRERTSRSQPTSLWSSTREQQFTRRRQYRHM